jgi:thioredoxin reductase
MATQATCDMAIHLNDVADDDIAVDGMNHSSGHRSLSFGTARQQMTVYHTRDGLRTLLRRLGDQLDQLDTETGDDT